MVYSLCFAKELLIHLFPYGNSVICRAFFIALLKAMKYKAFESRIQNTMYVTKKKRSVWNCSFISHRNMP